MAMKRTLVGVALSLGLALPTSAGAATSAVTPVEKVLQLLQGLLAKGKQDKHDEEVEFAKFQTWCTGTQASATRSIKAGANQIKALSAEIEKAKAEAEVLAREIAELQAQTASATADADAAKAIRQRENADFEAQYQDFSESIDACKRAIGVLNARSGDIKQSLLQLRTLRLPVPALAALDSFLESKGEVAQQGPPAANAYESQSGGVIKLLEKLTSDFEDKRLELEKAEMSAKSNFELLLQQLTDNIASYQATSAKKTADKASRLGRAASAEGELASTKAAKTQDEKTLADTVAECLSRSKAFEKDQVTRADEIKAIETAVGILSSGEVAGHAETHLPQLLQLRSSKTALAQLRSKAAPAGAEARRKLVEFLQAHASKSGSRFLAMVAVRAAEDPFAKVTKLIKELITKLSEEANAEADHHAYCTSELAMNQQTREDKASEADQLSAKLDQLNSDSARLAGEVAALTEAMAALRQQQAEATKIRSEERAINTKTIADAKEAQTAVAKATQVLKDFYGKAAGSLLQNGGAESLREEMSEAGAKPYEGQQAGSTGVFGLLEVILSDFARLEASTASAEDQAAAAHEKYLAETAEDLAVKETTLEHTQSAKRQTDERAQDTKKQLAFTQTELEKANDYFEKLKADCLDTGLSYEDRVKGRQEEIQSLQEALVMLDQQNLG